MGRAIARASCGFLVLLLFCVKLVQSQEKVLNIPPVFQTTAVYCWLATGQMVFQYFDIPANNPTGFAANDPRNYQCGEAKGIGAVPTGIPNGPASFAGACWNNCTLPVCMRGSGNLQGIYNLITQYPQIVAHTNGNVKFFIHPIEITSALSQAQVKREIDGGRPVIAGISPGVQYLPPGIAEHAVLIVGYADGGSTLVVNDPYPYQIGNTMPSYLQVGGQLIKPGQFRVPYSGMVGFIAWKNTIYNLQTSGNGVPAQNRNQGPIPPSRSELTCTIDSTSIPWNPPGTVHVRVDGKSVGNFDFGPEGSSSLDFSCKVGHHHFQFVVSGAIPSACSGSFDVDEDNTDFSPQINVSPYGQVTCSLH